VKHKVWADDAWLIENAGKTLEEMNELQLDDDTSPAVIEKKAVANNKNEKVTITQNLPAKKFKSNPRVYFEIRIGKHFAVLNVFIFFSLNLRSFRKTRRW